MLQEGDVLSDAEEDGEGESDFGIEGEVFLILSAMTWSMTKWKNKPCQKQLKCHGWLWKDRK